MDYKRAGVDVEAGRAFIQRVKASIEATHCPEVIGGIGGFSGLMRLPAGLRKPVLVAGTDGVGTKLELAQNYQCHRGVGIDLVAMCVNDVITCGATPLFFLDYIATGVLSPDAMAEVVEGIADGCRQSGCALLGGETAEMPGFYPQGRYDLAGFCVAVVEEDKLIGGDRITPGDHIIGIASSGVHSNGFSLVRKILDQVNADRSTRYDQGRRLLLKDLLTPTKVYASLVRHLLNNSVTIHGMAHITGGGLPENLPRCLPEGTTARIDPKTWSRSPLFQWLQDTGNILERDLWHTFNLDIGFCLVIPNEAENLTLELCHRHGHRAWVIGEVVTASSVNSQALEGIPS
ncbi:phosphoribosylformylglycinamidine cyclo-ligase [Synechococcus sp. M16CYN]|uniref:phosphoribosylformylglycinamidine cyclo-ligase n=1 Tax=Synechococcus sp. M16CYN TaxID=3103139 RepID=UPI00324CA876